jgi:hypothetical protein
MAIDDYFQELLLTEPTLANGYHFSLCLGVVEVSLQGSEVAFWTISMTFKLGAARWVTSNSHEQSV